MLLKELELIAPDSLLVAQLRLRFAWTNLGRALIEAYPTIHKAMDATLMWLNNLLRRIGYE